MFSIGIDVGGTHVRAAAIDSDGCILSTRRAPTPRSFDDFREWIVGAIQQIRKGTANETVLGVGLALPGVVDAERGVVKRCVNLPFLEGRLLRDELSKRTGLAVKLMTDADAATWGEYTACGTRPRTFVHLRLGTGIACGIVVDGRLQPTDPSRTTHWKVLVVDDRPAAIACSCGLRGCLETIASGPALERQAYKSRLECASLPLSPSGGGEGRVRGSSDALLLGLQAAWERNEPSAHTIIDAAANATKSAICNLKRQISEDLVVCLGGGVIAALPCLLEQTEKHLRSFNDDLTNSVVIHPSRLGDDAGVIGTAMLARGQPGTGETS